MKILVVYNIKKIEFTNVCNGSGNQIVQGMIELVKSKQLRSDPRNLLLYLSEAKSGDKIKNQSFCDFSRINPFSALMLQCEIVQKKIAKMILNTRYKSSLCKNNERHVELRVKAFFDFFSNARWVKNVILHIGRKM